MNIRRAKIVFNKNGYHDDDLEDAIEWAMNCAADELLRLRDACGCAVYRVGRCPQCLRYDRIIDSLSSELKLLWNHEKQTMKDIP